MAPKRKAPAASSSKAPATASGTRARRSKLAKEHDITAEEEEEIREAFDLFAQEDSDEPAGGGKRNTRAMQIATADVRRCLIALNTPPTDAAELRELLSAVDPDGSGHVTYEHFLAVAALKLHHVRAERDDSARAEEVAHAFHLFTKGQDRDITIHDLRRVAKELKEDVPENLLKDMLREATGGGLGPVGMEEFEDVMKRAGAL